MPEYYGFFESIADRSAIHPDEGPPRNQYEAVRNHLFLLLNTRQGAVAHLSDYGLPDLAEIYKGYPDSLHILGSLIEQLIENYEKRLQNVRVVLKSSSDMYFEASYIISGVIENERGEQTDVTFETTIGQNGKVEIER